MSSLRSIFRALSIALVGTQVLSSTKSNLSYGTEDIHQFVSAVCLRRVCPTHMGSVYKIVQLVIPHPCSAPFFNLMFSLCAPIPHIPYGRWDRQPRPQSHRQHNAVEVFHKNNVKVLIALHLSLGPQLHECTRTLYTIPREKR